MTGRRFVHVCKIAGIAGAENHLLQLLPGLADHCLDVHLLVLGCSASTQGFRTALQASGVPCELVPIRLHLDPFTVGALVRRLRLLRPTLIHTHLIHADLHGQLAAHLTGIPHRVSSRHNTDPFRRWAPVRWLNHTVLDRIDRVIAISDAVARFSIEVEGADPARLRRVPYGLDPATFPAQTSAPRPPSWELDGQKLDIVVVARAARQKGIDVVLDAMPQILTAHPTARLIVVGDGPLRTSLEHRARRLGVANAVVFTGWIDNAAALMPRCRVVVMPSRWEGFGMVALEAMAAARPVVASRVDALEEIVDDGVTGILVPPESPASLAAAVVNLLADPALTDALGRAGLERLQRRYTVSSMIDKTLEVYRELTEF